MHADNTPVVAQAERKPPDELRCPKCGGHEFLCSQLTWNQQGYNAAPSEHWDEWGSSENYCDDRITQFVCANEDCEADCTEAAIASDWDVYFEHPIQRRPADADISTPRLVMRGRNGWTHTHSTNVWHATDQSFIEIYSKRVGRQAPIQLNGPLNELVDYVTGILAALLTEQEKRSKGTV